MTKEEVKNKPSLSWNIADYKETGDEPPECVFCGKTEGEVMEPEDVMEWSNEQIRTISVIRESYPKRYKEIYKYYILDLEYLVSLGKITEDEKEKLEDKENFSFGQKTEK